MLYIHIHFFSLSSSIRSGLLAAVIFLKLNSKSHNDLARAFSKTCPLVYLSFYHFTSFITRWYLFTHATAITISALLCLVKYSLFAIFLHPASRCSTVSLCYLIIIIIALFLCRGCGICRVMETRLYYGDHKFHSGYAYSSMGDHR